MLFFPGKWKRRTVTYSQALPSPGPTTEAQSLAHAIHSNDIMLQKFRCGIEWKQGRHFHSDFGVIGRVTSIQAQSHSTFQGCYVPKR